MLCFYKRPLSDNKMGFPIGVRFVYFMLTIMSILIIRIIWDYIVLNYFLHLFFF